MCFIQNKERLATGFEILQRIRKAVWLQGWWLILSATMALPTETHIHLPHT